MDKLTQQDYKIMSLERSLKELLEMTREYHAEGTVSQRWFTEATYNAEAALKDPMSPLVPLHEELIEKHERLKRATGNLLNMIEKESNDPCAGHYDISTINMAEELIGRELTR